MFGTLIGAFIIAVIQNGMNLTGTELYPESCPWSCTFSRVLLDMLKKRG